VPGLLIIIIIIIIIIATLFHGGKTHLQLKTDERVALYYISYEVLIISVIVSIYLSNIFIELFKFIKDHYIDILIDVLSQFGCSEKEKQDLQRNGQEMRVKVTELRNYQSPLFPSPNFLVYIMQILVFCSLFLQLN